MLKPYKYATLGQRLLIVNPNDRKIVDIISPWKIVDTVRPWPRHARGVLNPRWEDGAR